MARLTDTEKKNLSKNLQELTTSNAVKQKLCAYTGIKQRTYETYLYGERGASPKALKLIADFFQTTPELLVSKNRISKEMKLRKMLRNYYPIWLDKTTTKDEQILDILRKELGTRGKGGKILYAFLTLIEAADFKIRIRPEYNRDEYAEFINGKSKTTDKIRSQQFRSKFSDAFSSQLKGEEKQKLDELKKTPEYKKLMKLLIDDRYTAIELPLMQDLFIQKAKDGEYTETSLRDLPLTFIITQTKDKIDLNAMDGMEDSFSMVAEVPIADMLDIQDSFLHEPFGVADDFLDLIYNALADYVYE